MTASTSKPKALLEFDDLSLAFELGHGQELLALDGLSFDLQAGEILALVGESGCGKSSSCLAALGLLESNARLVGGQIRYQGRDLLALTSGELRKLRGRELGLVFQDPSTAMNPYLRVGTQMAEGLLTHFSWTKKKALSVCAEWLERCQIADPAHCLRAYPHELSGGMRQRVMLAAAMALEPRVLLADEPTTALDVLVKAEILALMAELAASSGTAILLITHDILAAAQIADRLAVVYAGRVVESGQKNAVMNDPQHPYTRGLLASIPRLGSLAKKLQAIPGMPPRLSAASNHCAFASRCDQVMDRCWQERPPLRANSSTQRAACFLTEDCGAKA